MKITGVNRIYAAGGGREYTHYVA